MELADIRDWIKTLGVGDYFYIGKLENKKERSIGIYQRQASGGTNIALGGLDCTKTASKSVSILVHWTKYANEAETAAQELYDKLLHVEDLEIAGKHMDYLQLDVPEPIDVGTDNNGVYERVIWLTLYYER